MAGGEGGVRGGVGQGPRKDKPPVEPGPAPTEPDQPQQTTAGEREPSRYVALLERDNEFLREQVKHKDDQITDLSKRFGETQTLLGAMQRMLAPLLGQADPFKQAESRDVRDAGQP